MVAVISEPEANVVMLARAAVGAAPVDALKRLLSSSVAPPQKLGPTAVRLLSETLAKGVVYSLARNGGWMSSAKGRLWERAAAPKLHFSSALIQFFQWLLRAPLGEPECPPLVVDAPFNGFEQLVVVQLFEALKGSGFEVALAQQAAVRALPLMNLAHAAELGGVMALEAVPPLDVERDGLVVEGLRQVLTRSWVNAERNKRAIEQPLVLARIGAAQHVVLGSFLDGLAQANRRELAGFVVDAAVVILAGEPTAEGMLRSMAVDRPLRERSEARRQSAAFLRSLARIKAWDDEHRLVRFFDDEYDPSQALVRDWGRLSERSYALAARLVAELDAIPA
jgi:hypothetical protein